MNAQALNSLKHYPCMVEAGFPTLSPTPTTLTALITTSIILKARRPDGGTA
jgi:hypothetical protein